MGLQEQQNFLARLYTDPELREKFLSDPENVASCSGGLSKQEAVLFAEISSKEIRTFADSLFWKRFHEIQKLLPITTRIIDRELEPHFRAFSARYNPDSTRKHLDDAIEFAHYLTRTAAVSASGRDAAKYEAARLEFYGRSRRLRLVMVRHDISTNIPIRRLRLALWFRFRGRVYQLGT